MFAHSSLCNAYSTHLCKSQCLGTTTGQHTRGQNWQQYSPCSEAIAFPTPTCRERALQSLCSQFMASRFAAATMLFAASDDTPNRSADVTPLYSVHRVQHDDARQRSAGTSTSVNEHEGIQTGNLANIVHQGPKNKQPKINRHKHVWCDTCTPIMSVKLHFGLMAALHTSLICFTVCH